MPAGGCVGGLSEFGVGELVEWWCWVWCGGSVGFGGFVVCWVDGNVVEEDHVEELLEVVGGVGVEVVAVFEEVEGLGEVFFHPGLVGGQGAQLLVDGGQLFGDSCLLGLEEVERDSVGVVGVQEFGLFGLQLGLLVAQVFGVVVLVGVDAV